MSRFLVLLLLTACVAEPVDGLQSGIINGSTTTGQPWTVAVLNLGRSGTGGLCSGTLIGDYAVLTAKHCVYQEQASGAWAAVPPSELLIVVGTDIQSAGGIAQTSNVYEVRSTPGVYTDAALEGGTDIAVILLPAPFVDVTPQTIARSNPSVGAPATIVGFGRNDPGTDDSGVKYIGDTAIAEVGSRLIRAAGRSWTCQGDSGGPLLVGSTVHGVTSFGVGGCGSRSLHYFTNVAGHTALLDDALAWRPPCDAEPERCDGLDNDCNGIVDEGCTPLGETCTAAMDCGDGRCEDFGAGRVCVRTCDPRSAVPRCPFGFHCEATGCGEGACIEGSEGPRVDGDECATAADCFSRRCIDVGGTMRCSRQCDPSAGDCGAGNLCETASGCGDCVPVELSTSPRPFGSPCDTDVQCADGRLPLPRRPLCVGRPRRVGRGLHHDRGLHHQPRLRRSRRRSFLRRGVWRGLHRRVRVHDDGRGRALCPGWVGARRALRGRSRVPYGHLRGHLHAHLRRHAVSRGLRLPSGGHGERMLPGGRARGRRWRVFGRKFGNRRPLVRPGVPGAVRRPSTSKVTNR